MWHASFYSIILEPSSAQPSPAFFCNIYTPTIHLRMAFSLLDGDGQCPNLCLRE